MDDAVDAVAGHKDEAPHGAAWVAEVGWTVRARVCLVVVGRATWTACGVMKTNREGKGVRCSGSCAGRALGAAGTTFLVM